MESLTRRIPPCGTPLPRRPPPQEADAADDLVQPYEAAAGHEAQI